MIFHVKFMQIVDLQAIDSFFQISIHYIIVLGKPDCVGIGLKLLLEVIFRLIHHVHDIMK